MNNIINDVEVKKFFPGSILEYYTDNGHVNVTVEKNSKNIDIIIIAFDKKGNRLPLNKNDFDYAWKERNIYNQEVFREFLSKITVKEFMNMEYADTYVFDFFDMTTGKLYEKYNRYLEDELTEIEDLYIKTWAMNNDVLALCVES